METPEKVKRNLGDFVLKMEDSVLEGFKRGVWRMVG